MQPAHKRLIDGYEPLGKANLTATEQQLNKHCTVICPDLPAHFVEKSKELLYDKMWTLAYVEWMMCIYLYNSLRCQQFVFVTDISVFLFGAEEKWGWCVAGEFLDSKPTLWYEGRALIIVNTRTFQSWFTCCAFTPF